jgi:hypothetical protein
MGRYTMGSGMMGKLMGMGRRHGLMGEHMKVNGIWANHMVTE